MTNCQIYPTYAIFLKSQGSKDIKNDILDCQIHKYKFTNIQIQPVMKYPTCVIFLKSQGSKDIKHDILDCQIHKYKCTNTQIQIHKNTNTQIQIHKYGWVSWAAAAEQIEVARGHRRGGNLAATRLKPLLAAPPFLSLSPFIPSPFIWVVFCMNNILSIFSWLASKSLMWKRCFRLFQISRQLTPDRWWR